MTPVGTTLRAKQRARVRRDIDAAALRLFSERGFSHVTTDEIALAAGVSPSTYYRHVPNKEDLLLRPLRASSAAIVAGFETRPSDEPVAAALITAIRIQTADTDHAELLQWRSVISSVSGILDRVALITEDDRARLIEVAAQRMNRDSALDFRPGVTVCSILAVVEYGFRRWMSVQNATTSLLQCIDQAIEAHQLLAEDTRILD
jgi:AcrR family transcriptional regulator